MCNRNRGQTQELSSAMEILHSEGLNEAIPKPVRG